MKVISATGPTGKHNHWQFECPGCGCSHYFDSRWSFNGDQAKPTFTPSLLVYAVPDAVPPVPRCHSFVRDGRIEFLGDCTHALAGQTVELPESE